MNNRIFWFIVYTQLIIIFAILLMINAGDHIITYISQPSQVLIGQLESVEHTSLD